MTNRQMLKEVIERRRQWGETRDSDFDWLIKEVEKLQSYLEVYENTLGHMDNKYFKVKKQNKRYEYGLKTLRSYLKSTESNIPYDEKPLILTKSLKIIEEALEGGSNE